MILLYPMEVTLKFHVDIVLEVCQEWGVLAGHWGFLIGDMEDKVIPEFLDSQMTPKQFLNVSNVIHILVNVHVQGTCHLGRLHISLEYTDGLALANFDSTGMLSWSSNLMYETDSHESLTLCITERICELKINCRNMPGPILNLLQF